jgi:hypothetical protein
MKRELTNQELLDRYVHAVKMLLPPAKMDDIAAEVRSNLESQLDDRATTLGREPRPEDVSAMLKQYGHPAKVAYQYRDQPGRALIGPVLFPFYWFTVRAILALWVTIRVIVAVFTLQGTSPAGATLLRLGRDVLLAGLIIPANVTLLFAVWEYLELKFHYSDRWKPESLAPVPPGPHSQQPRPTVHIVGGIAWLVFFALALYSPWFFWVWGGRGVFRPSDTLYAMRFALWLLVLFALVQSWLGYTRFADAGWRRVLRIGVVAAGVALALFLLRSGNLLVAGPMWDSTQARPLATLNQMIAGCLATACLFAGLGAVRTFVHTFRRAGSHPRTADSAP